ncbi:MAG TPA: cell division protein FtsQ/DivIB [Steroidobacteraceae bacterium]|nr:cell division protein FtsQ/DivIB [Steroidobacteraceae bacterium]
MSQANRKRRSRAAAANVARWRLKLPALNWQRIGLSLAGVTVLGVAVLALGWLLDQPIQRVVVTGRLQRVSAMDVEKVVRSHLGAAGLVTVDLAQISRGLNTLPWVANAAVERSWPRGLKIVITEQTAVARWNNSGLLNSAGELFVSDSRFMPPELPWLTGPVGSEAEVTHRYLGSQGRLTEAGMRMAALELDARGAWSMTLDNGVVVRFGRERTDERFERFIQAAARLVMQRATDIGYVDMRYGNGFAIGWKGGAGHAEHSGERSTASPSDHSNG